MERKGEIAVRDNRSRLTAMTLTGVMTALITVCTMVLPIPIPMTTGYVNLGDGILFLSVMLVGWKYGAFAGGVGASLADLLLGSAAWAPWTLLIKAAMAGIAGKIMEFGGNHAAQKASLLWNAAGMLTATIFMAAGYYIAEGVMYGNWAVPAIGLPWNLAQGAIGTAAACFLSSTLRRTSAGKYFYR